jgi:hypothetical protein
VTTLTMFSILCRWAGIRGTIPQRIVVTLVIATILSAFGGQKVLSLVLILLVTRLVGELMHGIYSGNLFWDDEYDFQSRDWKNKRRIERQKNSKNTLWHNRSRGKQNTQQPTENSVGNGGGGTKRQEAIGTKWMVRSFSCRLVQRIEQRKNINEKISPRR